MGRPLAVYPVVFAFTIKEGKERARAFIGINHDGYRELLLIVQGDLPRTAAMNALFRHGARGVLILWEEDCKARRKHTRADALISLVRAPMADSVYARVEAAAAVWRDARRVYPPGLSAQTLRTLRAARAEIARSLRHIHLRDDPPDGLTLADRLFPIVKEWAECWRLPVYGWQAARREIARTYEGKIG